MPSLKNFSAAEEEDDQLGLNSEAARFNPEAVEKEEDPDKMDEKDESGDEEDDVKRDQVEAEDEEALGEEEGKSFVFALVYSRGYIYIYVCEIYESINA